jgi:hypothetical protein
LPGPEPVRSETNDAVFKFPFVTASSAGAAKTPVERGRRKTKIPRRYLRQAGLWFFVISHMLLSII